jgi:hypothetical protein
MMTKALSIACTLILATLLSGCATKYAPDPSLTAATGATLYGSRQANPNPFVKDLRTVVMAIDTQPTGAIVWDWDQPILLSPGTHTIQFAVRLDQAGGGLATPMAFEAGKAYVLNGERNGTRGATVWLQEKGSSLPAGEKMTVCLSPDAPLLKLFSACK